MSLIIDNAIAGWIRNAEKTGELKNNPHKGKPFDFEDYFRTPAEHRMSMKILKDANCLPPAVQMMKLIEEKQRLQQQATDPSEREALRQEIITLELKKELLLESM